MAVLPVAASSDHLLYWDEVLVFRVSFFCIIHGIFDGGDHGILVQDHSSLRTQVLEGTLAMLCDGGGVFATSRQCAGLWCSQGVWHRQGAIGVIVFKEPCTWPVILRESVFSYKVLMWLLCLCSESRFEIVIGSE